MENECPCLAFLGSQYSDYMVLDYSCLQGPSLSVCEHNSISSTLITESSKKEHRLFLRSPHYPNEYENSLNCSCQIQTSRSDVKFLDFYLEERDEMSQCSRDRLQIGNRSYCGSTLDDHKQINSHFTLNSSTELTFKSNDVITRKGFWLMMTSEQPLHVSCSNLLDTSLLTTTTPMTMMTTTIISTSNSMITKTSLSSSSSSMSMTLSTNVDSSRTNSNQKRRHALSYVLLLTIIFVVILLLLNLILMILCWRQKRLKQSIDPKRNCNHRPFFCSFRSCSSSSSSVTYGETPVLNSLDTQKPSSTSTRYIFQPNQSHLETTPSTSTTSPYEDLHDSLTLQKSKSHSQDPTLYIQQRQLTSPYAGYNRMIHFPPAPIRCHSSTPAQTFYPPQPFFDCQHIYETIQDGQCPYQRLSSTLRRPPPPPISPSSTCTCYCPHHPPPIEPNPETLV